VEPTHAEARAGDERTEGGPAQRVAPSKYQVITELGRGGMADVVLAMARGPAGFNKLTVLKQMREDVAQDTRFRDMLLDEARLAALLNHPNIVQTNEVSVDELGRFFIAMEYLEGQSLAKLLQRLQLTQCELPLRVSLRIAADALAGLHYAHELVDFSGKRLDVVHCDLSPHNLFVTYAGQVKVLDFGLARAKSSATQAMSGEIRGKLYYMAPEQAMAQPVDRRADIFAMGVVLWEMLTGHQLWRGQTDIAVACNLRFGEIPRLGQVAPELPRSLLNACQKALAFRPQERYATALEFQAALERVQEELSGRANAEEVGALVAELFTDERSGIRRLVESHMAARETAPSVTVRDAASAPSPSQPPPALEPDTATPERPARLTTRRLVAAGLAVLAALAIMVIAQMRSEPLSAPSVPSVPRVAESAQVRVEPAPAMVRVEIRARPEGARIFWDDHPLAGNPFRGQFERDSVPHRVRVEAEGHHTQSSVVSLTRDLTLDISLEAEVLGVSSPAKEERRRPKSKVSQPDLPVEPQSPEPEQRPAFEDPWGGT